MLVSFSLANVAKVILLCSQGGRKTHGAISCESVHGMSIMHEVGL